MSKANVQVNGFYDVKSNRILYRNVINDVNVTDWEKIDDIDDFEQSADGLKQWMGRDNLRILGNPQWPKMQTFPVDTWKPSELTKGIAWSRNNHVWEYGQRMQFWIPLPEDMEEEDAKIEMTGNRVVCINASGREQLTEGREYNVLKQEKDIILIVDDSGNQEKYFSDRFKVVGFDNWLKEVTSICEEEKETEEVSREIW